LLQNWLIYIYIYMCVCVGDSREVNMYLNYANAFNIISLFGFLPLQADQESNNVVPLPVLHGMKIFSIYES